MKKNKIILNYMPSGNLYQLSPTASILKKYLSCHDLNSIIIYWNLKLAELQSSFLWASDPDSLSEDENALLLFFNYLAIKEGDTKAYINVKAKLISIKPHYATSEVAFFNKHMNLYVQKLDTMINEYIEEICSDDTVCFMFLLDGYKWICASIIAQKIKIKYPDSIIIIGGVEYKSTAINYLERFNQFDFATWGVAEKTMFDLCNCFTEESNQYENIPNLAYRRNDAIVTSINRKRHKSPFTELNLRPDYTDYFEQKNNIGLFSNITPTISIENNWGEIQRGFNFHVPKTCNQCSNKPIRVVTDEILYCIDKFQIYTFHLSNHDLNGSDSSRFNQLLEALIQIKEQFPHFSICSTPIRSEAIDVFTIRKMMMAGFQSIQIDYKSTSENLLKKFGQNNTFANNLLLMKFASLYNITLTEGEIITGLPQETDEDILQAIHNLYYLRFIFAGGQFRHFMSKLKVMRNSRFYKQTKKNKKYWDKDCHLDRYLPSNYLKSNNKNADTVEFTPHKTNCLWDNFKQVEAHFIQNRFEYKLFRKTDTTILYKELFNDTIINEFELSSMDWLILEAANECVITIGFLLDTIKKITKKEFMDIEIINILENLKSEKLIYISNDYKEILSIINTTLVIS